jgi:hypothetical protein
MTTVPDAFKKRLQDPYAAECREWDELPAAVKRRRERRAAESLHDTLMATAGIPTAPPTCARQRQPRAAASRRRGSRRSASLDDPDGDPEPPVGTGRPDLTRGRR